MFKRGDFPGGWKEIKELRSVGGEYEKKVRRGHVTLVLTARGVPCLHCGSKSYDLSASELDEEDDIFGTILDTARQTYCPNCKKTMTPKEYEQYILTGEYRKHS